VGSILVKLLHSASRSGRLPCVLDLPASVLPPSTRQRPQLAAAFVPSH
jgi:hypothetical protein